MAKTKKQKSQKESNDNALLEQSINFMKQRFVAIVVSGLLLIASIVYFGADTEVMIRMQQDVTTGIDKQVQTALEAASNGDVVIKRVEFVGPQVGDELRDQGGIGMLFALAIVMVYVALRFQFKFSVAAVAALAHDVLIVLGFFSILKLDFDLTVLAAVLAVIGYSLNDTIVVADRIRENFRKIRKVEPIDVVNISLTQTLGRTLVTSLTTMLVLLALFFVGGELIHSFSIALIIGILVGTYSSIYVAANILLFMNISKEDLIAPVKEGEEHDELP
jgi:preprotein translocase subunit SecF